MVIPTKTEKQLLLEVDWSLDCNWEHVSDTYPLLYETTRYTWNELNILNPMEDIPQMADERFKIHDWEPSKRGDVVCISRYTYANKKREILAPGAVGAYTSLLPMVGVIADRCDNGSDRLMVNFHGEGVTKIINMPKKLLVKLPSRYKTLIPAEKEKVKSKHNFGSMNSSSSRKPKFELGDVVRISSSVTNEDYMGLIGVVNAIHTNPPKGSYAQETYEYSVDLDMLPNRNLALVMGEKNSLEKMKRFREFDLDEWDERISDKPHLAMYRQKYERSQVWVRHMQQLGTVKGESRPSKSLLNGVKIKVKVRSQEIETSCRMLDYVWDVDALTAVLSDGFVSLGVEEDKRNPNEKVTSVYLYVFELAKDVGKRVKNRILLGELKPTKKNVKRFSRTFLTGQLHHPWQVHRYLEKDSLGAIYALYTADDYLKQIGEFYYAE